jgi:hypothetical protein
MNTFLNSFKEPIKKLFPKNILGKFKELKVFLTSQKLQASATVEIGGIALLLPRSHLLNKIKDRQPFRDDCIGVVSGFLHENYPDDCVLDIGANIGDTCAHIRKFSDILIYCVEPHPIFFDYLTKNSERLINIGGLYQTWLYRFKYADGELKQSSRIRC